MQTVHELVRKNREDFLALPPEELAGLLLQDLAASNRDAHYRHRGNYCVGFYRGHGPDAARAVVEAWGWLETHGCLACDPEYTGSETYFVTRKGFEFLKHLGNKGFLTEQLTFKELLHPTVAQKSWSQFIRNDFESAIFEAMKQVEISVRAASGLSPADIGVTLMRKAFHPDTGPLADAGSQPAERQSLSDLFAGAIGSYKNPHSHRSVAVDRQDAVEVLMLAGHLLRIVESRQKSQSTP